MGKKMIVYAPKGSKVERLATGHYLIWPPLRTEPTDGGVLLDMTCAIIQGDFEIHFTETDRVYQEPETPGASEM